MLAFSWLVAACGTGNNMVPQAPVGGTVGYGYGSCSYGASYSPGSYGYNGYNTYGSYGSYGGCMAGYVFNGSMCVCSTPYYGGTTTGYPYMNCPYPSTYVPNYGCQTVVTGH